MFVAYARGAASARPMTAPALHDEAVASSLLPAALRPLVPRGRVGQTVARVAMLGLVDHIALRTAAIDATLEEWLGRHPSGQLVILGAGLDTRAYRLPALASTRVFEVDHPASQATKLAGTRTLSPVCRQLEHVAADFVKDDLDVRLAERGHDRTIPTAWILEGLTMYLPETVTRDLLSVAARRSAGGSMVAMTYIHPPRMGLPPLVRRVINLPLLGMGEPLGALYTRQEIAAALLEANFEPHSDTCSVEWSRRFGASATLALPLRSERLVVGER